MGNDKRFDSIFRADLFADQVILVTGGGTGIGRGIAHELASLGAKVVIAGRRPEPLAAVVAETIGTSALQASQQFTRLWPSATARTKLATLLAVLLA